jgi:uncharacterized membrane protein (UPF0127 family)
MKKGKNTKKLKRRTKRRTKHRSQSISITNETRSHPQHFYMISKIYKKNNKVIDNYVQEVNNSILHKEGIKNGKRINITRKIK